MANYRMTKQIRMRNDENEQVSGSLVSGCLVPVYVNRALSHSGSKYWNNRIVRIAARTADERTAPTSADRPFNGGAPGPSLPLVLIGGRPVCFTASAVRLTQVSICGGN